MPHRLDYRVLGHELLTAFDQKMQKRQHLRLDGQHNAAPSELEPICVEFEIIEPIKHGD